MHAYIKHMALHAYITYTTLFVLSKLLSSLWVSRNGSASEWRALQEAL